MKNISLLYEKRKDIRSYIELLLSISVVVIFVIFAIRPTLVTIGELRQQIDSMESTLDKLVIKSRNLDQAQVLINNNQRDLALLDTAVPSSALPDVYVRQLEGVAKQNNTILLSVSIEPVSLKGDSLVKTTSSEEESTVDRFPQTSKELSVNFDIRGTYSDIKTVINTVQNLRRPLFIDSLEVRILEADSVSADNLTLSVSGRSPFISQ